MFSLSGKKALVTGATGGIGGEIAKVLYGAGAQLAVSGSKVEKLEALVSQLAGAVPIACDLSKLDTVENLIKEAEEKLGGLDILVCNAGVTRDNLSMRMKDEEWQQVIDVNLTASFKLTRAAIKGMMKRRYGRIIYITSVVGWSGNPGQMNYCASKAGLTGMAKSLAQEIASRGITVNCIAPGFIATAMTDALTQDQKDAINKNIPLGRMGEASEIAAASLYLASSEAAYVTGQTIHVNGGMLMV
ncbi:MAG: 3-oxoacyl-[acyl-carrier-protein] reductase [Alphaproteobacteria bacterium]|nr:3-oxoacyl-[acyl-carrier-protein] reductase [Alphaproteobacteria bacterium]